ncbi:MAG: DNA alkylation repair protein [Phycisphaerae bacterium]|jgi:3-methyladenine DNA glycosylase AlkD|nr:DNA alkylation repair protein [Phycisphaerae bacterium]
MTIKEILSKLEEMGDAARRAHNAKVGPDGATPPEKQFGVKAGDIRLLAKKIKADQALALKLWETRYLEAQLLAVLLMKPETLSVTDLETMASSTSCAQVAEWLNSYVVAQHPEREALREKWMKSKEPWTARAGWHLTASLVNKGAGKDLDLTKLLDRIEKEMPKAKPEVQWTMNNTLMAIGVKHAVHRPRAIAIGEKIGLYAKWPMSKGCIIPYAPTAIEALAKRAK